MKINFFKSDHATKAQLLKDYHFYNFKAGGMVKQFAHGVVKLNADLKSRGVYTTDENLIYKLL